MVFQLIWCTEYAHGHGVPTRWNLVLEMNFEINSYIYKFSVAIWKDTNQNVAWL